MTDARDVLAATRAVLRLTEDALGLDAGDLTRVGASVAVLLTPETVAAVFDGRGALVDTLRGPAFPRPLGDAVANFVDHSIAALDDATRDLLARALDRQLGDLSLLVDVRAQTIIALLTARRDPERHVELFRIGNAAHTEVVH